MSTLVSFNYTYHGAEGSCSGISFAQALDHAKLDFLRQRGISLNHPKFRIEKAKLRDEPFRLSLSSLALRRYKELWLAYREDQLNVAGKATLADYQSIIKAKEKFNELNRIGV
jgi:hypothetical protein